MEAISNLLPNRTFTTEDNISNICNPPCGPVGGFLQLCVVLKEAGRQDIGECGQNSVYLLN